MFIFLWKNQSPCNWGNYALGTVFLTRENAEIKNPQEDWETKVDP